MVPYPGGDVRTEVAVAVGVFDGSRPDLDGPGAVGPLRAAAPVECGPRLLQQSRRGERHRAFHVIPGVGVTTFEPGDGARRFLGSGYRQRSLPALVGSEDTRNGRRTKPMQLNIPGPLRFL